MRCPRCNGVKKVAVSTFNKRLGKMVSNWQTCPQCAGRGQVEDPRVAMAAKVAEEHAKKWKQCPECNGAKFVNPPKLVKGKIVKGRRKTCSKCNGKGEVKKGWLE